MRRNIDTFYSDKKSNKLIIVSVLTNFLCCILWIFDSLNSYMSMVSIVFSILGLSFLSDILKSKDNRIYNYDHKASIDIDRKERFSDLTGKIGLTILTGDSGIGKSYLLQRLYDSIKGIKNIKIIDNNYIYDWKKTEFEDKDIIILDQFERALWSVNLKDKIELLTLLMNNNKINIIICIRKEYLGDILKIFGFNNNINFYWLNYSDNEKKEIITTLLNRLAGASIKQKDEREIYRQIQYGLDNETISFIQISYLCKIILKHGIDKVEEQWLIKKNYDEMIIDYLEEVISNFIYSDLAYIILYLICQDYNARYINTILDFQNITVQPEENINITVDFLYKENFIKKVKGEDELECAKFEEYEISHDYILVLFNRLCREKIDANIRSNIEFYHSTYQELRSCSASPNNHNGKKNIKQKKMIINDACQNFLKSKNKTYINIMLFFIIISTLAMNYLCLYKGVIEVYGLRLFTDNYLILAFVNIVVGESIYYIYNYYYEFLSIMGIRYILSIIIGAICCILAYVFPDYWAISLSIEILLMGILMLFINRNVRMSERKFFMTRFSTFTGIGIITFILGIYYPIFSLRRIEFGWPFFFLYGTYMLLGILGHINHNYILALIGKTLLIGKELDDYGK